MKDCYIITGTSSGLGLAFVTELIQQGAFVYSISRTENEALKSLQSDITHFNCNLADSQQVETTIKAVFQAIDFEKAQSITLVNNAGIVSPIGDIGTHSPSALINNLDTNLKAPILLMELFIQQVQNIDLPKFILNISSGAGRNPYAGWGVYCASKAGLDLFSSCVGVEQLSKIFPIKVISFAPGVVDTKMQSVIRSTDEADFKAVTRFIDLKNNEQLLPPDFVAQKLLVLLKSSQTQSGQLYDIRDFIAEKQR